MGELTLAQMFTYLPTLYKVYGPQIVAERDQGEKFAKAAKWLKEEAGIDNPSFGHIMDVAERL